MKKIAYFILGAMIVLAPFTASAIEALNTDSMKAATGQAGVTIGIDDVILYQNTGDITYWDNDGAEAGDTRGGIKFSGNDSLLIINAIITGSDSDLQNNYAAMMSDAGLTFDASALTIDVGTCTTLSAIDGTNNIGGVVIGLPTLELYDALANSTTKVTFEGDDSYSNAGFEFIEIQQTGNTMAILGGTLEIAPH